MGMPVITPGTETREQVITDLIQSVALQEAALAHILNAEGEKMQAIIEKPDVSYENLMKLNCSVTKLVNAVTKLELMYQMKLELFSDSYSCPSSDSSSNSNSSSNANTCSRPIYHIG
jgi:hypothetical protein